MNFSFAGCGFLGIYHVGVAACLKKYAPNLIVNKISGASAGALAAVVLLCDGPLGVITSSVLKTASEARKLFLGPFSPTFNIEKLLRDGLLGMLPDDAHIRVNGKIFISVTRVCDGKNVLLSHFETREELIQALLASAFIPGFSGWVPVTVKGVRYVDGGFSDNLPVLDGQTITVSPFRGEFDICPKDDNTTFMQALLGSCFIPLVSGWIPPSVKGVRYVDGFCSNNQPRLDGQTITVSPFSGLSDICPKPEDFDGLWTALLCSAFIPGFSGWTAPRVKGIRYVDGGFSDNLPNLDVSTVTISPFCGEADICPKDNNAGLVTVSLANTSLELSRENLYRFSMILFPPPPEILNRMCQQGFNDALEFLQRNHLINCTRCLSVQSTFNLEDNKMKEDTDTVIRMDEKKHDLHCADCASHRQEAILDTLPEAVGSILQDAIETANKGLMNWVFKHKSMKLVTILTLPYVIPIEVVYATFVRFSSSVPAWKDLQTTSHQLIKFLKALIQAWTSKSQPLPHHHAPHHHHEDNFSCQLNITEFTGEGDSLRVTGDKQKIDFAIDLVDGEYHAKRNSVFLDTARRGSLFPDPDRRTSMFPDTERRGSIFPDPERRAALFGDMDRRGSMLPDMDRRGSMLPNMGRRGSMYVDTTDRRGSMYVDMNRRSSMYWDKDRRGSSLLEAEALTQLALRCAIKSSSHHGSLAHSRGTSLNPSRAASRAPSRAVSRAVSRFPSMEDMSIAGSDWNDHHPHVTDDTFDRILDVTNQQDAVMAYYYMDENNEMRVTEIFDMTATLDDPPSSASVDLNHLQSKNVNVELTEGALKSHLESFKDGMDAEEKLERTTFSKGSLNQSRESVVSEPEADQFIC